MNKFSKPTDAELEILQVLWHSGSSSVRFVNELLAKKRDIGYTTTLKMMQLMHEKGFLVRDDTNRAHTYIAAIPEADTQRHLLDEFVDSAFRGSTMKLIMQALGNHPATDSELEEIKTLIEKLENKEPIQ